MQTPANFIRLRSLSFDAAIAGAARTCEVKDGFLIIPVVDTDEALTFIGKLGELPARESTDEHKAPGPSQKPGSLANPLGALGATAERLRNVADVLDQGGGVMPVVSGPSPHANGGVQRRTIPVEPGKVYSIDPGKGVDGIQPVITEKPEPKVLPEEGNMFAKTNGAAGPAVNAPGGTEEPPTGVRAKPAEKPKQEKKPKADKPARNVVDDVAAHEAATAEPTQEPVTAEAPKEEPAEEAPSVQEDGAAPLGLDEAYIAKAPRLRDIVVYLYENGLKSVDAILGELGKRKEHPLVSKAVVDHNRVERMLEAAGISAGA